MQQRSFVGGVAGQEDVTAADLAAAPVVHRHAGSAAWQRGVLQAQVVDIRLPAAGRQQPVEAFLDGLAVQAQGADDDFVAFAPQGELSRLRDERQFVGEDVGRQGLERGVGERADAPAAAVQTHAHPQPVQRLRQFQPDDAGAGDGHRRRQRLPGEDIVVDDEPVAQFAPPGFGHRRARTGGDDDAVGQHARVTAHVERVVVDEARVALQPMPGRPVLHGFDDETDEAVALAAHAVHHRRAVDDQATAVHAKASRVRDGVRRLGGGDEQLARHAAHAGAGGAVGAAFDDDDAACMGQRAAVGRHAGGAGADDGHVNIQGVHGIDLRAALTPDARLKGR